MPLDAFIDQAYEGLDAGKDEVPVGDAKDWYDAFEPRRQEAYQRFISGKVTRWYDEDSKSKDVKESNTNGTS